MFNLKLPKLPFFILVFFLLMGNLPYFAMAKRPIRASVGCPVGSGDVDGSGKIMSGDALLALKYAVGWKTLTEEQLSRADVNGDCKVTSTDALNILKLSVGKTRKDLGLPEADTIELSSFLPADKSRYLEGMTVNCVVQAKPTNPQYQYQFLVDGQPKRAFSATNTWNWQTTSQDIGIHTLTIQLKNQFGSQIEKSRRLMIYRRPIEP